MGIQEKFQVALREAKAREQAMRTNPTLANTPAMKKLQRQHGVAILILGLAVALGDAIAWKIVGGGVIVLLAIPLVLIPSGIYMIVTGTNPFRKK